MELAERLIALEHEGWHALVAGNGGAYYRKHLTANAVMAFPFGTLPREDAVAARRRLRGSASRYEIPRWSNSVMTAASSSTASSRSVLATSRTRRWSVARSCGTTTSGNWPSTSSRLHADPDSLVRHPHRPGNPSRWGRVLEGIRAA